MKCRWNAENCTLRFLTQGRGQLRVIDESGEDYLYPRELFVTVDLPQALRRRVLQAA